MGGLDPRLLERARRARAAPRRRRDRRRDGAARARAGGAARARRRAVVRRRVARRRLELPLVLLAAVVAARARARLGLRGRRSARGGRRCSRSCGSTWSSGACATSRPRSTARESAEVATAAVAGVDALETLFARYLPQLVLATVVPVAVLDLVASIDLVSAGVMLLTLPLVPRLHVADRPRRPSAARASAGRRCGCSPTHFLDVVRGLPTLRAFNRGRGADGARSRASPTSTAARRWARCASRSSRAPCSSWRRRSASRSSR